MTSQKKTYVTHILMIIGLVLPALIPVGSFVLAQEQLKHFSSPHSISTSDFGIESPAGMAYSAEADSFIVWSADNALHTITLQEEMGGKLNIAQSVENPLGMAFEDQSNSLFILSAGDTELAKIDMGKSGLPDASDSSNQSATRFDIRSFDLQDAQGLTFDAATGRLFILDARRLQVLIVSPHLAQGFDGVSAEANNRVRRLSVESLTQSRLRGIAFNPNNGHLYVGSPAERKVYELTEMGERVSTYDVSDLNLENPTTMLFAPSRDATDEPTIMDLYILDSGQNSKQGSASRTDQSSNSQMGQIVELSLQLPAALPPGTIMLAATLVRTFATSNVAWNPSSPDPSGIDYWPARQHLLIVDSEVDEMPNYYVGKNVFESTTSGVLTNTCDTTSYSDEPSGLAINPTNNHLFISDDNGSFDSIYEVSLGPDGAYCTADDIVTVTNVNSLYNVRDAEDVAYGNNTLFIAGGDNAEVYIVPLGANGVLGGGDDGSMTHFDTAALGFKDLEGIGYNLNGVGTLFIVSTIGSEKYLGETTKSGTLLRAYDLSFMGSMGNLRSDVTYAPSSQNPAVKNIYIASRGVDNASNPNENDGKVWEVRISTPVSGSAHVEVNIGGALKGTYDVAPQDSERPSYVGVDSGPVKVQSTNNVPIVAALRDAWMDNGAITSSIQLMGLPENLLSDTYLFPAYNNVSLDDQLRFANVGTTPTTVTVTIGGIVRGSYNLNPSQGLRVNYAGLDSGPVVVKSSGGVKLIASIRDAWHDGTKWSSYAQLMGLPKGQLSDTYLFPAYNNVSLNDQLRFGNVGTVPTIVTVTIGGIVRGTYPLNPNQSTRVNYSGLDSGPVEVKSSGGVKIIASIRDAWFDGTKWTSYFQLMGLPKGQLSDTYLFPAYDNVSLDGQLRFGNVGSIPTTVTVTINGVVKGTYNLAANQSMRVNYAGLDTGPVKVQSSGGSKIIASLRDSWFDGTNWTSYSQLMGLPATQLSTVYLFPAYNNVIYDNQLRIAVP